MNGLRPFSRWVIIAGKLTGPELVQSQGHLCEEVCEMSISMGLIF